MTQQVEQEDNYKCICDCGCFKVDNFPDEQCEDCDDGIHYDELKDVYVDYNEEEEN